MSAPIVLLVEDEESFIDALLVGLKREGFRVEVARDGFEALERFDIVRPDIVLLDVMLPKISGIDVCRQLRKRSQVPIIMRWSTMPVRARKNVKTGSSKTTPNASSIRDTNDRYSLTFR